jgi:hypothetical protein
MTRPTRPGTGCRVLTALFFAVLAGCGGSGSARPDGSVLVGGFGSGGNGGGPGGMTGAGGTTGAGGAIGSGGGSSLGSGGADAGSNQAAGDAAATEAASDVAVTEAASDVAVTEAASDAVSTEAGEFACGDATCGPSQICLYRAYGCIALALPDSGICPSGWEYSGATGGRCIQSPRTPSCVSAAPGTGFFDCSGQGAGAGCSFVNAPIPSRCSRICREICA